MANKNSPQVNLRKSLEKGDIKRAEKALNEGAILRFEDGLTGAEIQMVSQERHDLWTRAIKAPTSVSIRWLIEKDPLFIAVDYSSTESLADTLRYGSADTLALASDTLLPVILARAPLLPSHLRQFLDVALTRQDNLALAWVLKENLLPDDRQTEDLPAIWKVMHKSTHWQMAPRILVPRLALLMEAGQTSLTDHPTTGLSPLATLVDRYDAWINGHGGSPAIKADYEKFGPVIWDMLVRAGGDPNEPDATGQPLWLQIEQTPLGQRHKALARQSSAPDGPSKLDGRRRPRA